MSRFVPSRSRASSHAWPRVVLVALIGVGAASCSDSGRFGYTNTSSRQAPSSQETTGSIARPSAPTGRIVAQPLPAPSAPATVSSNGTASGAQGLGAYRPGQQAATQTHQQTYPQQQYSDVTGSVRPVAVPPPAQSGAWTWDGGKPVTVGYGETADQIARKHGVPVNALLSTNGIASASAIRPGQRLVIPRYVTASAAHASAPAQQRVAAYENAHTVAPGESLMSISRHYGVTLTALTHANNIQPATRITVGDRLTIPGGRPAVARPPQIQAAVPQLAQPRTIPSDQVATMPAQNARIATQEPEKTESVVQSAEPAGNMQTFRWPVKGRVIAGFGPKANGGGQNDGINLAVPEGTPVKAADDGVVAYAGNELKGYGNLVLIRHANGFVSAYAHASEIMVKRGDSIKRGQVIANAGQTGNVTSPQLHFEIRKGSTPVDPTKYLSGG